MAKTYKVPGVFVEEISTLPASIVPVATAIPAFIGYTEEATEIKENDLYLKPTRISSLLEYEELFGDGPELNINQITLNNDNNVDDIAMGSSLYLYDSLRMFFTNGGSDCYIVSIGNYKAAKVPTDVQFTNGLTALEKYDEPTLILFPDAVLLGADALAKVQVAALTQCNKLQDRFAVFDLLEKRSTSPGFDWKEGYEEFRQKVGMSYLKYGAAYTPWLKASLSKNVRFRDVQGKVAYAEGAVKLSTLIDTDDTTTKNAFTDMENVILDVDRIEDEIDDLVNDLDSEATNPVDTMKELLDDLIATLESQLKLPTPTNLNGPFKAIFNLGYGICDMVDDWAVGSGETGEDDFSALNGDVAAEDLIPDIKTQIKNALKAYVLQLVPYDKGATAKISSVTYDLYKGGTFGVDGKLDATEWGAIDFEAIVKDESLFTGTNNSSRIKGAYLTVAKIVENMIAVASKLQGTAIGYEKLYEADLIELFPIYRNVVVALNKELVDLPPSGAVVGKYAAVDDERGVWKAPANVSLASVSGLTETIDDDEQALLNVDATSGKSINAIRAFTGKGILIWGARTLAGNDNEWRYVPVRRFFIFVEESVKKATSFSVFEPNDANTWVRLKSMIENFLTELWKQGALAGPKPEKAFFVNVGLGVTMTAQDILEGRLIIEIGMAAVRPAEFIILRFSHKLQEA
jgi:phage tail sheath protein FI